MPGAAATAGSDLGWTEAFYDPADATDQVCTENALNYLTARRNLLTPGWRAVAIRISQLDASNNLLRKGRLVQIVPANGVGTYALAGGVSDEQAWDAINLSIQTLGGSRRAFLMRGIGSNVVGPSGVYLAPPAFVGSSAAYATGLAGRIGGGDFGGPAWGPYALRTRSGRATTNLTGVFTAPVANVNIVCDQTRPMIRVPAATVQAGNQVSLAGILDMPGMNGQWRVTQVQLDPTTINFAYVGLAPRRRKVIKSAYTQGGIATYWNWTLDNISGFTVGAGASRRTGRPPQQHRGRRSARPS